MVSCPLAVRGYWYFYTAFLLFWPVASLSVLQYLSLVHRVLGKAPCANQKARSLGQSDISHGGR